MFIQSLLSQINYDYYFFYLFPIAKIFLTNEKLHTRIVYFENFTTRAVHSSGVFYEFQYWFNI